MRVVPYNGCKMVAVVVVCMYVCVCKSGHTDIHPLKDATVFHKTDAKVVSSCLLQHKPVYVINFD